MAKIKELVLPDFGCDADLPALPVEEYQARIDALIEHMKREKFDMLLVYADREHFANISFLTGFDPRFEEALLLVSKERRLFLIVGNECMSFLPDPRLQCEAVLFQEFSLLGQPRNSSIPLKKVLQNVGVRKELSVGCVGWKYFDGALVERSALDIPSYIADTVREIAGATNVCNATDLLMNPDDGLRAVNSARQLAQFEFASCRTSTAILKLMDSLKPDVRECDLESLYDGGGLPLSCHRMVSFGEKARRGLASPSSAVARVGDAWTAAFGIWGALTCRAGVLASGESALPTAIREFYPKFVANYFDVVATWYESAAVGAAAGDVYAAVNARRDRQLYDFAVNPGHLIHLDEWVHSPFTPGSKIRLRSGVALQMDIIPVSKGPFCCANAEDGIALADEALRKEIAQQFPQCWKRIVERRKFMIEELGIGLDESVLPLSNIPGWFPPYALDRRRVFVKG